MLIRASSIVWRILMKIKPALGTMAQYSLAHKPKAYMNNSFTKSWKFQPIKKGSCVLSTRYISYCPNNIFWRPLSWFSSVLLVKTPHISHLSYHKDASFTVVPLQRRFLTIGYDWCQSHPFFMSAVSEHEFRVQPRSLYIYLFEKISFERKAVKFW